MTLWWLRMYPTYHLIALVFDLHPATVARHLQHTTQILHNQLRPEIQWPTNAEWYQLMYINISLPIITVAPLILCTKRYALPLADELPDSMYYSTCNTLLSPVPFMKNIHALHVFQPP